jgi:hypothetical protein
LPPKFWLWTCILLGVLVIARWRMAENQLVEDRGALLARQRTVAAEHGTRWDGLRDKIEKWSVACGEKKLAEVVDRPVLKRWDFRSLAGIYLRVGIHAASDAQSVRQAAEESLHDGFTSCLIQSSSPDPLAGKECIDSQNCAVGELCGDLRRCVRYTQPYNLRLAYRTLYVLSDEWIDELHAADGRLAMRATEAAFDSAMRVDIPVAIELLNKASYFMVVVDEPAPLHIDAPEGAKPDSDDRGVSTDPHDARVCVWRLSDDRPVLAIRRRAEGQLHGTAPQAEKARKARQRQANSCALALAVREAMGR